MSVIKFSTGDVLRSKMLANDWYKWLITAIRGPYPSKDQTSNNFEVTFTLIEHTPDTNGKEMKRVFSAKAMSMMIPLIEAVRGVPAGTLKEGFDFDFDEFLGKKVDGLVTTDTYEGQLQNRVETYAPYGSPHQSAF